jgi:hypothetical protein
MVFVATEIGKRTVVTQKSTWFGTNPGGSLRDDCSALKQQ